MKITIESTTRLVTVNAPHSEDGIQCRVWEGVTEHGIRVQCLRPCGLREMQEGKLMNPPKALEQIADVVLNYRPKSKQPKTRKRKKAKREQLRKRP